MAVDIYFSYSPSHIQYSTRGSNLENSKVWYFFSLSYAYIYFAYVKCTFIIEVTLQLYLFILWNTMIWSMISIIITYVFHNYFKLRVSEFTISFIFSYFVWFILEILTLLMTLYGVEFHLLLFTKENYLTRNYFDRGQ